MKTESSYVVIALVVVTSSRVRGLGVGRSGVSAIGSDNSQQGSENQELNNELPKLDIEKQHEIVLSVFTFILE